MAKTESNVPSPEWWKHLRPENKRKFWKKVRKTVKFLIKREVEK